MHTQYTSTRNNAVNYSASQCVIKGLSDDGGLFVPCNLSEIKFDYKEFIGKSYGYIAKQILKAFFSDFTNNQIEYAVDSAYNINNFETKEIFTLKNFSKYGVLELFRGKTLAFKDAALSVMPYLMQCAKENMNEKRETFILTATSGDTGKAALEGFKDVEGIKILVFYPYKGVSELQLLQMLTQEGKNTYSFAVEGNFDDVQTAVKNIFTASLLQKEGYGDKFFLSSANSINISRLIPQIVYYYYAYSKAVLNESIKAGDEINFVVPTGNFGNILAGYYAKKTGLPIKKLICASNKNNVLTDYFNTGCYNKNRPFYKTIAPSMDILISSNLERLVYETEARCDKKTSELMGQLSLQGIFENNIHNHIFDDFYADYATEDDIKQTIKDTYKKNSYLIDPHTACAFKAYNSYITQTKDNTYTVILSTASPFKFSKDVLSALGDDDSLDGIKSLYRLSELTAIKLPKAINGIENRHKKEETVITPEKMSETVISILKDGEKDA